VVRKTQHVAFLEPRLETQAVKAEGERRESVNDPSKNVRVPPVTGAVGGDPAIKKGLSQKGKTRAEIQEFWDCQDWRIHDAELARQIGCSRAIVGRWRNKLGKAASSRPLSPQSRNGGVYGG
jgi:hypothetical protein